MNGLALCAGIGGLELGLHIAVPGYRTVGYVEREAYAAAVLVARMEDKTLDTAPVWDDLTTFDGKPWRGVVDIISAGDPCQPWSHAGQRKGYDDERVLFDDIARIVGEVAPALVFLENVPGAVDFRWDCKSVLEGMGYRVEAGLFSAEEVGAPHQRVRLFLLAHKHMGRCEVESGEGLRHGTRRDDTDRCDKELAHPSIDIRRPSWDGGQVASDGTGTMVDTTRLRERKPHYQTDEERDEETRRPDGNMADTYEPGRQKCRGGSLLVEEAGRIDQRPTTDRDSLLPLFPPGPSDLEAWRGILAVRPDLAPAVDDPKGRSVRVNGNHERQTVGDGDSLTESGQDSNGREEAQPELCGVADGMAYRDERLRCCGNGVVPQTAALAFVTLWNRLGG